MTKLLKLLISLSLFMSFMFSQNDENPDADKLLGNVTCVGAIVEYTYVTREMESADDEEYGQFWKILHTEFLLTKKILLELTGQNKLMEDQPAGKKSIDIREEIVLPLLTIQQFALMKMRNKEMNIDCKVYEKIILRSLFGNINASRNSA